MTADTFGCQKVSLECRPWTAHHCLWWSPSCKACRNGHETVSMTRPRTWLGHESPPLTLLEPVASAIWSSWSVLIVILLISKEVQSCTRAAFLLCPNDLCDHGPTYLDDCPQFFSVDFLSSHCPYLAYRMFLHFFCISSKQSLLMHVISIWAREAVSGGCVQVRVSHVSPW